MADGARDLRNPYLPTLKRQKTKPNSSPQRTLTSFFSTSPAATAQTAQNVSQDVIDLTDDVVYVDAKPRSSAQSFIELSDSGSDDDSVLDFQPSGLRGGLGKKIQSRRQDMLVSARPYVPQRTLPNAYRPQNQYAPVFTAGKPQIKYPPARSNSFQQDDRSRASRQSNAASRSSHQDFFKPKLTVNQEQKAAADRVFNGHSIFLTGAAGTGKSYLLRYIINGFEERYSGGRGKEIAVTASTGIAATHIDGQTIHSWAGIGLGKGNLHSITSKIMGNKQTTKRWRSAKVLIIDEISMLDGAIFDLLDAVGKRVRNYANKPFGGLQLVLCGDFFQLPPVSLGSKFAFQSKAWSSAKIETVELKTVTRQAGDTQFINLLGQVRLGVCPGFVTSVLSACHVSRKKPPNDGIEPTKLYCTNKNVDAENNSKLSRLSGKAVYFKAKDSFKNDYSPGLTSMLKDIVGKKTPDKIELKVGAQVIMTRNMPEKNVVNGSRGVVQSFETGGGDLEDDFDDGVAYPFVVFTNGTRLLVTPEPIVHTMSGGSITRHQVPLKLAWCLTVHKSQGMTLDRAELQLEDAFDYGQVYVALSRVTSLVGLWIRGKMLSQSIVKAHPEVAKFYSNTK